MMIHLERSLDFCFVNNCVKLGILAWKANMGLKPAIFWLPFYDRIWVFSIHGPNTECLGEKIGQFMDNFKIAQAYASKIKCSLQGAVYHTIPEVRLRIMFLVVMCVYKY